jgi:hypothetical protein
MHGGPVRRAIWNGAAGRQFVTLGIAVALLAGLVGVAAATPSVAATGPCGVSAIACENAQPGDPGSDWQVNGAGDPTIQGYATSMSVNVGQTVSFKIETPATSYHIDILRLGYYQGDGARKVVAGMRPSATLPQSQPACLTDSSTGLIDCGNWAVSASWMVPSAAVSGVYLAHLVRDDTGGSSLVPFVVRNDASHSDILVQTSDETWEAYNSYYDKGPGNSLYQCNVACPPGNPGAYKGAFKVSYNRPFHTALDDSGRSWIFYSEDPMIRFLEANGYDVSYVDGGDVDARGSLLLNHKVFISDGHDEYWSGNQRANVEAARDNGVNLAFFSGNEVFWKTRWEPAADGSNTPYRTLVSYKETHFNGPVDPNDPPTWTGSWADPRFSPPADGGRPQNALTGQLFVVNAGTTDIQVPSQYSKLRFWRGTAVANLVAGQSLTLDAGAGTLGYEWDEDSDNGFRPPGLIDMSSTTSTAAQVFVDYGTTVANGTATHHLTLYRAPSGALVFGAGTVQWSWGLDNGSGTATDLNMQQATVNLFADMGVQPYALLPGLTPATQSTDTTPPISTITSPAPNSTFADGAAVTISGTATDGGGGVVAGVEISTDGGSTWHPTVLSAIAQSVTWSYTWVARGVPSARIETRAVDDSGNLETPSAGESLGVGCPCYLWGPNVKPTSSDSGDASSIEVGVKFTSDTFGTISGIRFYKAATNTGTHIGNLWTSSGQLLATATFANETTSGWQQVNFSSPVPIMPHTTYVASYFAPSGHYAGDDNYFYATPAPSPAVPTVTDSPPLHAPRATVGSPNGMYTYSFSSTFPISTDLADNYWVDVAFSPAPAPGQVTNVSATGGFQSAAVSWSPPTSGGPATTYTITPYIGATALTPTNVSGSPAPTTSTVTGLTNGTTYTFVVTASNPNGSGPPSVPSAATTPTNAPTFVQQVSAHGSGTSISVTPGTKLTAGSRLIVEVGVWNSSSATAASVTDSAGSAYTELTHFKASDGTEMSVWSSPVTSGAGATPTITARATSSADIGIDALEYVGLSSAPDATVVDQQSHTSGTTGAASTVTSGATPATTAPNELALGFYADSGFGDLLTAGTGWTSRANISRAGDMELLVEDQPAVLGTTPNAAAGTGASTVWLMAALVLKAASTAPTAPGAPTGVSATAANAQATVSWTAPSSNGGSPITSYTVTPFIGTVAQPVTTVTGSPPPTLTTVTGLTNGSTYTFTVAAANAVGTGTASAPSNAVTPTASVPPAFVQAASTRAHGSTVAATTTSAVAANDRIVVEVGVWSSSSATTASVTDSAGNSYTELTHFQASDDTELSVWTAPISKGGGAKLTVTAKPTSAADVGLAVLEYAGLSTVGDATAVDQQSHATGSTGGSSATVASGPTAATTAGGELAIGFYVDSGFGDTLKGGSGWTQRLNVSPTGDMELLAEDQAVTQGTTPNASMGTGPNTPWLVATVVFKHA